MAASAVLDELAACGMTHFVTVPDYVQISINHRLAEGYLPSVQVVSCATEDEAVAIAFGLHIGGKVPWLSMQNQGLFACANALRSVGLEAGVPVPILVGQWGRELSNLGHSPTASKRLVVRKTEALCDAFEMPYFRLESAEDLPNIRRAFEVGREQRIASVVLVGSHTSWE
ncbi:MAG: thiamine pyrophosphate-binding protein [Candidatus Dormibacteria bacterium]